jgi:hypothetical protein
MFGNVENFKNDLFSGGKKILKENKESDAIVENVSFVEMASSELINYSTNMCHSGLVLWYY